MLERYRTKTYTWDEFMDSYNKRKNMELLAKEINKDNRLKKMAVFVLGSLMYADNVHAAGNTVDAITKLNAAGNTLLGVMQTIGYWVALIMCIVEILKSLSAGDTKSIGRIIVKYLMAFAGIFVLKWLFDLIRLTFGG